MKRHRWTKEELEYLAEHYESGNGVAKCCDYLGLSAHSVKQRAVRLGVAGVRRNFTQEEIDYIKKNYSSMGPKGIAKELNVNWTSVATLVQKRLHLKCDPIVRSENTKRTNKLWVRTPETKAKIGAANRRLDGVSPLRQVIQNRLYTWRYSILERDGYSCIKCGKTTTLEVHHVKKYIEIRQEIFNLFPELAKKPNENKDVLADLIVKHHKITDGITLCKKCHINEHFGKRGELLGNQTTTGDGNQQPSRLNVIDFVSRKVQRLTGEDSQTDNPDTSAPHTATQAV